MTKIKLKDTEEYGRVHGFDEMFISTPSLGSGTLIQLEVYDYAKDYSSVDTRNRTIPTTPDTLVYVR